MKNTLICLLLAAAAVSAQNKQRVAVLPSVGDLNPQGLILLTDKVREIATKNLPIEDFNILKQDVITRMIGEEELYRSCKEGVCIGDLAKKTNANYGARCDVIMFENRLVLKFELYSVNEEAIFETFTDYGVKNFDGMLASLETRLPATFKKMVSVSEKAQADAKNKAMEQQRQETAPKPEPPKTHTVAANANPPDGGTVSRSPNYTAYYAGTQVTITASPNAGYTLAGWSGVTAPVSNSIIVTVENNLTLTANFQRIPQPPPAVAAAPPKGPIKAAVYVTGVPDLVGKTLNSAISSALIKSKIYAGIESINVSGASGVPALADAGRNAGVSYIFAINVAGQISVAIIDVAGSMELAKISIDGKITAISAAAIAKKIVDFILTSGPKPDPDAQITEAAASGQSVGYDSEGKPRILQNRISIEGSMGGGFGSYRYSYGDTTAGLSNVRGSGSSGGFNGYFLLDLKYFEFSGGGIVMLPTNRDDAGFSGTNIVGGYLAKYPFVFDQVPVKVTPILGGGNITVNSVPSIGFMFGGRIDVGISEIAYLRSEYLYNLGMDLGAATNKGSRGMSLKAGGGIDIAWGKKKKMFWRTELMYNWLSAYNPEYKYRVYDEYGHGFSYEHGVDGKSSIHYVDIRTGLGYKWGGKK